MENKEATVLVVDDEAGVRLLLQGILESAGYRVITAENGQDTILAAIEYEPDLILLDIMLPDISGYEVHKKLCELRTETEIPVIFITALDERVILDEYSRIGRGVDYILKPLRADILLARVTNILDAVQSREELKVRNAQLKREMAERHQFAAVVRQISDSVLVVDDTGVIVYANPACEENCGYTPLDLVGKSLPEMHRVQDNERSVQEMMDAIHLGEEWYGNIPNQKKDGSFYLEEISALPVRNGGGQVQGHVVMKKDVTERRRLESIASAANLMDNVGFVFSGIRHELGNPVNSLKMTLSVLSKKIDQFSQATIVEFLERSQNEIARIEYLLKSLRSFSMFEKPVPDTIFIPGFLNKIIDIHRKDLEAAQIELTVQVAEDAENVYADDRALVQVMLNLLSNAIYSMKGRRQLQIKIEVSRDSDSLVCMAITDNGVGISEKNKEMLFKPFYTTKAEGTGLGLVIAQKMLVEMDCSIQVESKEDEGATFSILLPVGLA